MPLSKPFEPGDRVVVLVGGKYVNDEVCCVFRDDSIVLLKNPPRNNNDDIIHLADYERTFPPQPLPTPVFIDPLTGITPAESEQRYRARLQAFGRGEADPFVGKKNEPPESGPPMLRPITGADLRVLDEKKVPSEPDPSKRVPKVGDNVEVYCDGAWYPRTVEKADDSAFIAEADELGGRGWWFDRQGITWRFADESAPEKPARKVKVGDRVSLRDSVEIGVVNFIHKDGCVTVGLTTGAVVFEPEDLCIHGSHRKLLPSKTLDKPGTVWRGLPSEELVVVRVGGGAWFTTGSGLPCWENNKELNDHWTVISRNEITPDERARFHPELAKLVWPEVGIANFVTPDKDDEHSI